jgi:hypothetical protein
VIALVRRRALLAGLAGAVLAALATPTAAFAHGIVGRQDLPIPRWLFAWAAAVVLVVSFVGLAVLWPKPRLQGEVPERRLLPLPGPSLAWEVLAGAIGVGLFVLTIYAGFAGVQVETANFAPIFVHVAFWNGMAFASVLFGDVFRAFNPWRAIARAIAGLAARLAPGGLPAALPYPRWLGRWPAAIGILCYAWLELASTNPADPSFIATLALVYAAVQLIGMSLYGIDAWSDRGDAFGVCFGLFSRLSPLHWRAGTLSWRPPLAGAPSLPVAAGTVELLAVMIGTTSFDGFSQGPIWNDLVGDLQSFFGDLGLNADHALEAARTVGLIGMVLVIASFYRLGIQGVKSIGGGHSARELSQQFAHTLIPIALAYIVAHYFSQLMFKGQAMAYLISDPLGDGSDIFGTADRQINYFIGANGIWYTQVAALVLGHASGLVLAHDRALAMYRKARDATRSQYWMLAVMVAFTSLGLWLLSAQSS